MYLLSALISLFSELLLQILYLIHYFLFQLLTLLSKLILQLFSLLPQLLSKYTLESLNNNLALIGWLWCISFLIWLLITFRRFFNLWNTYLSFLERLRLFLLFHYRLFNQPCHHIYLYIFRRRLLCGTQWIIFRRLLNKLSSLSLLFLLLFILISKRVCVLDYYGLNDSLSSWRGP